MFGRLFKKKEKKVEVVEAPKPRVEAVPVQLGLTPSSRYKDVSFGYDSGLVCQAFEFDRESSTNLKRIGLSERFFYLSKKEFEKVAIELNPDPKRIGDNFDTITYLMGKSKSPIHFPKVHFHMMFGLGEPNFKIYLSAEENLK